MSKDKRKCIIKNVYTNNPLLVVKNRNSMRCYNKIREMFYKSKRSKQ